MKMAEINAKIEQTDIHTTLIANGILDVINPEEIKESEHNEGDCDGQIGDC